MKQARCATGSARTNVYILGKRQLNSALKTVTYGQKIVAPLFLTNRQDSALGQVIFPTGCLVRGLLPIPGAKACFFPEISQI
jgi:hypothetical protein